MMTTCTSAPTDKRAFGKAVGDELLKRHGKRRYYSLHQIRMAMIELGHPAEWESRAFALYGSPWDFKAWEKASGQSSDRYARLKEEMFNAMTDGASEAWFNVDMSWLEWPDFDFGSIFEFFDLSC